VSQAGVLRGGDKPGRSVLRPYMTEVTDALATRPNGGRSEPRPYNLAHDVAAGFHIWAWRIPTYASGTQSRS